MNVVSSESLGDLAIFGSSDFLGKQDLPLGSELLPEKDTVQASLLIAEIVACAWLELAASTRGPSPSGQA